MALSPSSANNKNIAVNKHIGTAYDKVALVADNLDSVLAIVANIDYLNQYQGASSEPPTTRKDGSPLQSGDYYFDIENASLAYYRASTDEWFSVDPTEIVNAANEAEASRQAAKVSEDNSKLSEEASKESEDNAKASEDASALSETAAKISEDNAKLSEDAALLSEEASASSEANSKASELASKTSEVNAKASEELAVESANTAVSASESAQLSSESAETSASNASEYEEGALAAQQGAELAQAQAEALFQQFGDQYLGSFAEEPTVDNSGNPLDEGDIYWDSTDDVLKFYSGSAWVAPEDVASTAAQEAVDKAAEALVSAEAAALSEANTATMEANVELIEINVTALANSASDSASAASTSETNSANNAMESEASAVRAETAATTAEDLVSWQQYARKEAEMQQMREQNKNQFAASGFVNFGKTYPAGTNFSIVNEGLFTRESISNVLQIGRDTTQSGVGNSKTDFAVTCIAGLITKLVRINTTDLSAARIKFREPPKGTEIFDSSGDARGTGSATLDLATEIDPKYGDIAADDNEAKSRAFEGIVLNGDFRNGDDGSWTILNDVTISTTGATFEANGNDTRLIQTGSYLGLDTLNKSYELSFVCDVESSITLWLYGSTSNSDDQSLGINTVIGVNKVIFSSPSSEYSVNNRFMFRSASGTFAGTISNVSLKPSTEEVVIERVDMFGFEFRPEQADAIYPYGCNQSKATTIEGIITVDIQNNPVFDGDTDSVGKGVITADLTTEQKIAILSNPEHNLWLDSSGVLQQWIVEQRTFRGAGNGAWLNVNPTKGDLLFADGVPVLSKAGYPFVQSDELGVFEDGNGAYFLVCGTVPRLNFGLYHINLNPLGCAADINGAYWYNTSLSFNSTADCFDLGKISHD